MPVSSQQKSQLFYQQLSAPLDLYQIVKKKAPICNFQHFFSVILKQTYTSLTCRSTKVICRVSWLTKTTNDSSIRTKVIKKLKWCLKDTYKMLPSLA